MRLLPLLLVACNATALDEYELCSLELTLNPAAGAPGDVIEVTGTPFTEIRDTRFEVGGVRATVSAVERIGCDDCDLCRFDAGCGPCGICQGLELEPSYRTECFGDPFSETPTQGDCGSCVETMVFVVPDVAPGLTTVFAVNRNGQSEPVPFEVLPGPAETGDETGDSETGAPDTADDTGTPDTGDTDTGDTDTGTPDTGDTDTGDTDTGTPDTGDTDTADTGAPDTGAADTGAPDTSAGTGDTG